MLTLQWCQYGVPRPTWNNEFLNLRFLILYLAFCCQPRADDVWEEEVHYYRSYRMQ
jgi:hypothetical protein